MPRKKLKIALFSTPWEAVPPIKYGGTELVVYNIADGLIKRGHDVTVFATGDSDVSAKLDYIHKRCGYRSGVPWSNKTFSLSHASYAFSKIARGNFDIVHNHYGMWGIAFLKALNIPYLTTYHGDLTYAKKSASFEYFKMLSLGAPFVSISKSQAKNASFEIIWVGNVYNGIDVDIFEYNEKPKDYFAWLGRFTEDKGAVEAIYACKKAGVKLVLAGKVDKFVESDVNYFNKRVKPLLDGKQIKYIGEVNHQGRVKLLKNARGLVDAIKWNEPFGLVLTESMACGTPVIANGYGSIPEVILDKKTGFVTYSQSEIVEGIKNIDTINRRDCYSRVVKYFSNKQMVKEYEKVYYKILS